MSKDARALPLEELARANGISVSRLARSPHFRDVRVDEDFDVDHFMSLLECFIEEEGAEEHEEAEEADVN